MEMKYLSTCLLIFLFSVSALFSGCTVFTNGDEEIDTSAHFYVSPDGNDDWTGTLPEPDPDGTDGPFATIGKARNALRELISAGMDDDLIVMIRGGSYYLDSPLVFIPGDSGRGEHDVVYRNYPREEPVINGGQYITGWEHHEGNIYKAKIDEEWEFHTLYENGVRSVKARFPNEGYSRVDDLDYDHPRTRFQFKEDDIPKLDDIRDLQVYMWPGGLGGDWNWFSNTINILDIDYATRTASLKYETHYEMGKGSRYFIQGALELLDAPGEFYLDKREGVLYYWPREMPIEEQDIVAPKMDRIIVLRGSQESMPIQNIRLEGLTIRNADISEEFRSGSYETGIILLENANNITIKDCRIHNSGLHGIFMNGWVQNNTIYGNLIYDIGHTAIQSNGPGATLAYKNKGHTISNNYIYGVGTLVGHGAAIQLSNSGDSSITHNRIHDASRYAISMKGPRAGMLIGRTIEGIPVTAENAADFSHSRNNFVAYNDMSNVNTDSQDTGIFEAWGPGTGNVIHNNRFHDSNIHFSFGFGIYLDDACNYFTVTNNLVYDLQEEGEGGLWFPIFSKGIGNKFFNNVVADNNSIAPFGSQEMAGEPNRDLEIERNVFYNSGDTVYKFITWEEDRYKSADHNLIYNENNKYKIAGLPGTTNFEGWLEILDGKFDQNSVIANPLFVDPVNKDYRFRYDSPAYDLGIENIDIPGMGLKEDFVYADPDDPLKQVFVITEDFGSAVGLNEGDKYQLEIMGRTETGFVADLQKARIRYSSDDTSVASVNRNGEVTARGEGITSINISVTKDGITQSTIVYVIVGGSSS
jgi:parallel beta-helix repeat protein